MPEPVRVPTPNPLAAEVENTPVTGGVSPTASPHPPAPATQATAMAPSPGPLPSAFAQTNTYTFGSAPQNNFAAASAPAQIFYVTVSPSVVHDGDSVTVSAITSTNVAKLSFGPNATLSMASLQNIGPGKWQSTFPFSSAGLPVGQTNITLSLTATTGLGASVSLPIPMSLMSSL